MALSDDRFLDFQRSYLEIRKSTDISIRNFLDFEDFKLIDGGGYSISRMRVVEEAKTGINELLNWINHFALSIADFRTWSKVLASARDKEERFSILVEIITPIAFHTLSFPAAIRGKLVFVCCKIIRDTFNVSKPNGKRLADHEFTERVLRGLLAPYLDDHGLKGEFNIFLKKLNEIDGEVFRTLTLNYRNRANHQIAPSLESGERFAFASMQEDGIEGFTFGVEKAVSMAELLIPLEEQHTQCREAFNDFWLVVLGFNRVWKATFA